MSIRDLSFAYDEGRPVLEEVDLEIEAGERFGIIGPSGAGKSTLLLHLNGILSPAGGSAHIGEDPVDADHLESVRSRVGLVFQDPDDQLFNPTVYEDVAFGPRNMGKSPEEVDAAVRQALEHLDLRGMEEASSHHLSYGERKRVALATVLSMRPEVVAFDEPFSNLHPAMVERLIGIIRDLPATIVVVSQSILPVLATCDRLALLDRGRVRAVGGVREIASDTRLLAECGLDYTFYCRLCREAGVPLNEGGGD
ncbi:MAG: ABC transporter ATP-binding protein [bacterium]